MRLRATKLSAIGFGGSRAALPSLDLAFALDKTLTARKGPTPTFTRGSGATQVNASGLIEYAPENLVLRSQEFNTSWAVNNAMTVTPNAVTAPDGTLTADAINFDANASSRIIQFAGSAAVHTFSVWLRAETDRTCIIEAQAASAFSSSLIANVTTTWQRFSVVATNWTSGTGSYNVRIANNVAGTSGTIYAWGAQLERNAVARTYNPTTSDPFHAPRFDHDPVTLACKGLLIEESRTNLTTQSSNASVWTSANGTVTNNGSTTAPDGSSNGFLGGIGTASLITLPTSSVTGLHTASVFLKRNNTDWVRVQVAQGSFAHAVNFWVNLATGAAGALSVAVGTPTSLSAQVTPFGDSWYRISITASYPATSYLTLTIISATANSSTTRVAGSIYEIWGAQLESGSFPTSYIPTTTTALTRSADVCSITGADFTSFWNQSEGSIFSEFSMISGFSIAGRAIPICQASNNTFNELIRLGTPTASLFQALDTSIGALQTRVLATTALSPTAKNKSAAAYKVGNNGISSNSSAVATSSPASISSSTIRFDIGALHPASGQPALCGHIARIQYFKKRLPNAKLQSLTTP